MSLNVTIKKCFQNNCDFLALGGHLVIKDDQSHQVLPPGVLYLH